MTFLFVALKLVSLLSIAIGGHVVTGDSCGATTVTRLSKLPIPGVGWLALADGQRWGSARQDGV